MDTFFNTNCDNNVDTQEFNVQGIGRFANIEGPVSPTAYNVRVFIDESCSKELDCGFTGTAIEILLDCYLYGTFIEIVIPPTTTTTTTTTTSTTTTTTANPGINYCVNGVSTTGWRWYIQEDAYNNFGYPYGIYNPVTNTLEGLPARFYAPGYSYNGYMRILVWNCSLTTYYIIDQWTTINSTPIRNWPSNVLAGLPTALDTYEGNQFTIPPYNT